MITDDTTDDRCCSTIQLIHSTVQLVTDTIHRYGTVGDRYNFDAALRYDNRRYN